MSHKLDLLDMLPTTLDVIGNSSLHPVINSDR